MAGGAAYPGNVWAETPVVYNEVVRDLGRDPLDPADAMHDAYAVASQYHQEALERLQAVVSAAYR